MYLLTIKNVLRPYYCLYIFSPPPLLFHLYLYLFLSLPHFTSHLDTLLETFSQSNCLEVLLNKYSRTYHPIQKFKNNENSTPYGKEHPDTLCQVMLPKKSRTDHNRGLLKQIPRITKDRKLAF